MFPPSYCPLSLYLRKLIHMPHRSCTSYIAFSVYRYPTLLSSLNRSSIITSSISNKNCLQLSQSSQAYHSLESYYQYAIYKYQNIFDFHFYLAASSITSVTIVTSLPRFNQCYICNITIVTTITTVQLLRQICKRASQPSQLSHHIPFSINLAKRASQPSQPLQINQRRAWQTEINLTQKKCLNSGLNCNIYMNTPSGECS